MKAGKVVEEFLTAIENNNFTKADNFLSKDFKAVGLGPDPLNSDEFLGAHLALNKGLPDFRFNFKITEDRADRVYLKVKITGTHKNTIPSPAPGIKAIPATNKSVVMPEEPVEITVKDNKITKLKLVHVDGGGLMGLMKQLGVELPAEVTH
ncbi:MAG: ester cyclase [Ignavibacteria bacterium]|jgi:hypothetical protein|nr:ester cyclase [Ignavibacteria bacterium]MCU7504206.1 ester cyclase [Ignavibacteria bacterium]MCU7516051.1 ester cyclase [Ignavibacteria bacterium]